MNSDELTNRARTATTLPMQVRQSGKRWSARRRVMALGVLAGCAVALGGCISINAPDKPIVIELNINIKQEVIYRLAEDVKENIESNPEIF